MSINHVSISGNLTRSPELRSTTGGTSILSFGIAVNERVKNGSTGEWEDHPNFFDCVMFGKRADSLSRILDKGMKVAVSGRLRYSSWEKDGQKRSKVEVIADEIDLMQRRDGAGDNRGSNPDNYSGGYQNGPQNGSRGSSGAYQTDTYDDDIPF